jgi:amidase
VEQIAINDYLPTLKYVPTGVRCLQDLIDFNEAHPELERPTNYTDQTRCVIPPMQRVVFLNTRSSFIRSQETEGATPELLRLQNYLFEIGAKKGIDEALYKYQLDALVIPMNGM